MAALLRKTPSVSRPAKGVAAAHPVLSARNSGSNLQTITAGAPGGLGPGDHSAKYQSPSTPRANNAGAVPLLVPPSGPPAQGAAAGGSPDIMFKMSKKIAQLTKVIYFLNTRNEDHQAEVRNLSEAYEKEIEEVRFTMMIHLDPVSPGVLRRVPMVSGPPGETGRAVHSKLKCNWSNVREHTWSEEHNRSNSRPRFFLLF
jgi:hypothetical protein